MDASPLRVSESAHLSISERAAYLLVERRAVASVRIGQPVRVTPALEAFTAVGGEQRD